ncbi:hypothetical protein EJ08DRAFT_494647 [Tothia fuscella]|uniref:Uncharacterized protein n=1 Tax=Tothia fuscella TaxID=1048955 RepID=A0A9P4NZX4_9PEZI|nr:hypothetical protein EJ08DRAFT_494647 [Tothia fuscella]
MSLHYAADRRGQFPWYIDYTWFMAEYLHRNVSYGYCKWFIRIRHMIPYLYGQYTDHFSSVQTPIAQSVDIRLDEKVVQEVAETKAEAEPHAPPNTPAIEVKNPIDSPQSKDVESRAGAAATTAGPRERVDRIDPGSFYREARAISLFHKDEQYLEDLPTKEPMVTQADSSTALKVNFPFLQPEEDTRDSSQEATPISPKASDPIVSETAPLTALVVTSPVEAPVATPPVAAQADADISATESTPTSPATTGSPNETHPTAPQVVDTASPQEITRTVPDEATSIIRKKVTLTMPEEATPPTPHEATPTTPQSTSPTPPRVFTPTTPQEPSPATTSSTPASPVSPPKTTSKPKSPLKKEKKKPKSPLTPKHTTLKSTKPHPKLNTRLIKSMVNLPSMIRPPLECRALQPIHPRRRVWLEAINRMNILYLHLLCTNGVSAGGGDIGVDAVHNMQASKNAWLAFQH